MQQELGFDNLTKSESLLINSSTSSLLGMKYLQHLKMSTGHVLTALLEFLIGCLFSIIASVFLWMVDVGKNIY